MDNRVATKGLFGIGNDEDEPDTKKMKFSTAVESEETLKVKMALKNIYDTMMSRLDSIEKKVSHAAVRCQSLEEKIDALTTTAVRTERDGGPDVTATSSLSLAHNNNNSYKANVSLIPLNTEADFPSGSWLGDESNPEQRVRCPISPSDLELINNSPTPEKMALTLLDHLFDRDTQACSNLSGLGKHGKKQLDPLLIYGMRCHLAHKFGITESDWLRIKQNLDSKCRTAFRRKLRGMPLKVKAFQDRFSLPYINVIGTCDVREEPSSCSDHLLITGLVALPAIDDADVKESVELSEQLDGGHIRLCPSDDGLFMPQKRHGVKEVDRFVSDYVVDVCSHHQLMTATEETLSKEEEEEHNALIGFGEEESELGVLAAADSMTTGLDSTNET